MKKSAKPRAVKVSDARPSGRVAQHWYNKYHELQKDHAEYAELMNRELTAVREEARCYLQQRDSFRSDRDRVDKMYQQMDAKLAAIKRALSVISVFDADRWSEQFRGYELLRPKLNS